MQDELEDRLLSRYPKIFGGRRIISASDGRFTLINGMCEQLQFYADNNRVPQVEILEIKEKYGGLRIDFRGGNALSEGIIDFVENFSDYVCEVCGKPGKEVGASWARILCAEHR